MSNETFDPMFMTYLTETLPDETPLADRIGNRQHFGLKAQQDHLKAVERDADLPVFADTFDNLEHFSQQRITKALREGVPEPPPTQTRPLPAELEDEKLRKALGVDEIASPAPIRKAEPSPFSLPRLLDARSLGREPLPPGPALLDQPIPEIFERVAERAPTERGREFAREMAERARALESMS